MLAYLVVNALRARLAFSAGVFLGAMSGPIVSGESSMAYPVDLSWVLAPG